MRALNLNLSLGEPLLKGKGDGADPGHTLDELALPVRDEDAVLADAAEQDVPNAASERAEIVLVTDGDDRKLLQVVAPCRQLDNEGVDTVLLVDGEDRRSAEHAADLHPARKRGL